MSRNVYDTPVTSMYKYKGLYNRKQREFYDRPNVQAKGLAIIRRMGNRIQETAQYDMAPAEEVEGVDGNQDFGSAKEIFSELEKKQSFYGSRSDRLNSDTYITE